MNNLAYGKHTAEDVAPKVEEIIRKDLGLSLEMPYIVEETGVEAGTLNAIAKDAANFFFGGKETLLFKIRFDVTSPRPASILVNMNRQGVGCHAGSITFSTFINKPISSEVSLEEPKTFGTSKFKGDADASTKLNNNKDILKGADKLARVKSDVAGGLRMDRYFKVIPSTGGCNLVVITLARATSMGIGATTDAKDFFSLAAMIEAAL